MRKEAGCKRRGEEEKAVNANERFHFCLVFLLLLTFMLPAVPFFCHQIVVSVIYFKGLWSLHSTYSLSQQQN